ncbi:hypothetical protein AN639_12580 [Candidatus Epulonipiscium fishelsonii]|uniref:Uncharacterized protein n=1 Tax=Candidatus Epulonipiscium fishelsonii TaxID=77094 RepID=A0ACC8XGL6_9FIRM|nr:hypothetical protein AN639_12580 [Epulopiscium sp. SCG-B05WGA-EpuloA1]ONI42685.1 hypothetical protein AN396_13400 [Epulopiscium sp. SCG-B11WGA-EpuloA1]
MQEKNFRLKSIVGAVLIILLTISISMIITFPEIRQSLLDAKSEILKSFIIGLSILPVMIFIIHNGGKNWTKSKLSWIILIIACGAVFYISVSGEKMARDNFLLEHNLDEMY